MGVALSQNPGRLPPLQTDELADAALGLVLHLSEANYLTDAEESLLISRILARDANMLILAKRLGADPLKFRKFALTSPSAAAEAAAAAPTARRDRPIDAVIIGAGLAGLTATLTLVDRGANVVLIDKNRFTGGNSAYASSGINAVSLEGGADGDSIDLYLNDTVKSSGRDAPVGESLMSVLASRSSRALEWFRTRVQLPLEVRGQVCCLDFHSNHC